LLNNNLDNEKRGEPFHTARGLWSRIIVPRHSPFFVKSLVVYFTNGEKMDYDVHYRIYSIMSGLTELTAEKVACFIEFLDPEITDGFIDYDVVGEFTLFDTSMMHIINSGSKKDGMVEFDNITNKPVVWPGNLHGHSLLKDVVAFGDMIEMIDLIMSVCESAGKPLIQTKIEHYFGCYNQYLKTQTEMLKGYLGRHVNAYNSHGLDPSGIGLDKVDNFATARGPRVLEPRDDLHLTVEGLKTIIDEFSFNPDSYTKGDSIPISSFGNTNFIPPSIDGSYEGLGGQSETAGICQESDGSVVFLENRFDGRVDGLYYSVMQDPYAKDRKREYSGYRYTHQRIENDNAQVNRIAQGSGKDVILVTDTDKNYTYVGLTFGSLNPARHVLSRIDLSALMTPLPTGQRACDHISWMQVMLMGDWVYISFAHSYVGRNLPAGSPGATERRYRYYYRVSKADVAAQLPVTAQLVRLTYTDPEGVSRTNADYFRFYTPVGSFPSYTRCYFPIKQTSGTVIYGNAYSQHCLVEEIPHKPGKYVMKIVGAFLGSYASGKVSSQFQVEIEATYEVDPDTGVMTLLHQTPKPQLDFTNLFINWLNSPPTWRSNYRLVYGWDRQGMDVLPDGTIMVSTGDYTSFPRGYFIAKPRDLRSRYEVLSKQWNTSLGVLETEETNFEDIPSPLASGIKPKSFLLSNGGDFYTADSKKIGEKNRLYYRKSVGRLAARADVTNSLVSNVRSRPLTNTVWEVRGEAKVGGASITVPSSQLASYGTDLGDCQFCVGTQRRYLDLPDQSAEWTQPTDMQSIKVISDFTTRVNSKGLMEIVPKGSVTYPSNIVQLLKREVDSISEMLKAPEVIVVICDPSGAMVDKYGWLPVLVWISWGRVGTTERHDTMLSISPTYSGTVNRTVTGYSVLDRIHLVVPTGAIGVSADKWDGRIGGDTNYPAHGSPRVGYYLNGNTLSGFFDSGVTADGQGDALQMYAHFRYLNRSTKRWSTSESDLFIAVGNAGGNAHRAVTPDNGVVEMIMHPESAGGAATIFRGSVYNPMLGSVYPEVGWTIFVKQEYTAVFNGRSYTLPKGILDLRDIDSAPANKTFYLYALFEDGIAKYEISQEKRLETAFQIWVARIVTNDKQIITLERFNVFAINGRRVSELKRGGCIPASSGITNAEGQIPWLRSNELS